MWLLANLCGIALYLCNSAVLWPEPEDQGFPGGPGDGLYWLLLVAPILFLFLVANFAALLHIARTRSRAPRLRLLAWLFVAAIWFTAFIYDAHRSRHIDPQFIDPQFSFHHKANAAA